jgi:cytidylate kinase
VETFLERLGSYLSDGLPEVLPAPIAPPLSPELTARAARLVVASVAEEGPAVIVGHGAQCVLEGHPGALHVLLYAQLEVRAARAGEHYGLSDDEASERIRESDAQRRAYIREHFDREWLDPTLYHLALDTGSLGVEGAVELIRRAAARTLGGG